MMSDFRSKVVSYQQKIYPGYSDTCEERSLYSDLYHLAVSDFNQDLSTYDKCVSRLNESINEYGMLEEQSCNIGAGHSSKYVSLHMTSIYYHFLYEHSGQLDKNLDLLIGNGIEEFCSTLCFDNAWSVSNEIMALGTILYRVDNHSGSNNLLNLSNWLLRHNTFKNGLWESADNKNLGLINSAAATFHYLPLFLHLKKPVPSSRRYIEYAKKLYMKNGFFSAPNGYACIDYDVVYMIFYCVVNFRKDLKRDELDWITFALSSHLKNLHGLQNTDGGFAEYGYGTDFFTAFFNSAERLVSNKCINSFVWNLKKIARQSLFKDKISFSNSVIHCGSKMNESNIFATWFRLITIEAIEVTLGLVEDPESVILKEGYDKAPGLGYMPYTLI
jgi:hypothetical protein